MNTLFKAFAALVAAFNLVASAFATEYKSLDGAKVYDCRATGNSLGYKTEVLTEYTDEEIRGMAAAGLKPSSRKYWTPTTLQKCEDLWVKKPTPKNEVKALPAKPASYAGLPFGSMHSFCVNGQRLSVIITQKPLETLYRADKCTVAPASGQAVAKL